MPEEVAVKTTLRLQVLTQPDMTPLPGQELPIIPVEIEVVKRNDDHVNVGNITFDLIGPHSHLISGRKNIPTDERLRACKEYLETHPELSSVIVTPYWNETEPIDLVYEKNDIHGTRHTPDQSLETVNITLPNGTQQVFGDFKPGTKFVLPIGSGQDVGHAKLFLQISDTRGATPQGLTSSSRI